MSESPAGWVDDGRVFVIHDPEAFAGVWLPAFFQGGKLASFVRKLYRWGFRQVKNRQLSSSSSPSSSCRTKGGGCGGTGGALYFFNENFQRNNKASMKRFPPLFLDLGLWSLACCVRATGFRDRPRRFGVPTHTKCRCAPNIATSSCFCSLATFVFRSFLSLFRANPCLDSFEANEERHGADEESPEVLEGRRVDFQHRQLQPKPQQLHQRRGGRAHDAGNEFKAAA